MTKLLFNVYRGMKNLIHKVIRIEIASILGYQHVYEY